MLLLAIGKFVCLIFKKLIQQDVNYAILAMVLHAIRYVSPNMWKSFIDVSHSLQQIYIIQLLSKPLKYFQDHICCVFFTCINIKNIA